MRPASASLPVAVFDSGVGGLTVLHECLVSLPHEDFVYLGDTARFPYGSRSAAQLEAFAHELAEELLERGAKLLVVACNSATAAALPALRESLIGRVGVVGVIEPEAAAAARATRRGEVGLLATPATVASGSYADAIGAVDPFVQLTAVPCADLAKLIERASPWDDLVVDAVRAACEPLRDAGVDTVVLGCIHYSLVSPLLQRMLGRGVHIVTSGAPVAHQVEHVLGALGLANPQSAEGRYRFLCTGDEDAFAAQGTRFLQMPLGEVEPVTLRGAPPASSLRARSGS